MSKKITMGHEPILKTAKRIVERTAFFFKRRQSIYYQTVLFIYVALFISYEEIIILLNILSSLNILTSKIIP